MATVQVVIAMYFLQKSLAYHVRKLDRWEVMGGKSSLIFYKTTDDRFVLRQILRFEYQAFLNFASLSNSGMITEFLIIENLFYNIIIIIIIKFIISTINPITGKVCW